jgi:hypothetical protein
MVWMLNFTCAQELMAVGMPMSSLRTLLEKENQ